MHLLIIFKQIVYREHGYLSYIDLQLFCFATMFLL